MNTKQAGRSPFQIKRELDDSFTYLFEGGYLINTDDGDRLAAKTDLIKLICELELSTIYFGMTEAG